MPDIANIPINDKSFEKLFKDYYAQLTVFADKYINDLDTAREIVQDFFVKLYETRESVSVHSSLKNFLYKSVKNSCLNYLKKHQIRYEHHRRIYNENQDEHIEYSENEESAETEYSQLLYTEIENLPPKCHRIFILSRFDSLKNDEIAKKLNISKRTVETQISLALKSLRKKFLKTTNTFLLFF